jgi:hypothetical protein
MVPVSQLARTLSVVVIYVRRELDLLLILLCLDVLLLNRLGCGTSTALGNLLHRCSSVLDGPFPRLVLELGWIPNQHAGDLGVLWIFRFGSAEERLQRDKGRLDGEDWRPLRGECV